MSDLNRRTFVKGAGVAGAAALLGTAPAGATGSTQVIDDQFDMTGGLQEALVVFDSAEDARRLDVLDHEEGYRVFEHVGIAHTFLTPDQIGTVAEWDSVRRVKRSEEIQFFNDSTSRESMAVEMVQKAEEEGGLGYRGEDAHVVVIDTGINASHPAIEGRVDGNYQYVDQPFGSRDALWVDTRDGDPDELGHGMHCAGIAAGDGGGGTQGDYRGMAPEAKITGYSTTQWQYLPYVVSAWNHMLGRVKDPRDDFDPDVVTNSYGVARGTEFNPNDPVNVATWEAFKEGLLVCFAMGNDGPGLGTGSRFAKAPHVLGVAATQKDINPEDNRYNRPVTDFSSRGRDVDDLTYHNREQTLKNLREYKAIQNGTHLPIAEETRTGRVGGAVNLNPFLIGFDYESSAAHAWEQFTAQGNADVASLTLSLEPEGQWVYVRVYEKVGDEEYRKVAAMREEIFKQHDVLTFDVSGGTEYLVSLEAEDAAVANYELLIEQSAKPDGDLRDARPLTLYRPGIGTHGNLVMSSIDRYDVLGPIPQAAKVLNAAINQEPPDMSAEDGEPFYVRLSGTSMACPAAAGIGLLCYQAYREAGDGSDPDPIDVIRILESTARDFNPDYTPANIGSGFIDAERAVQTAEEFARGDITVGDLETGLDALVEPDDPVTPEPDPALSAEGSRADDGHASTGDHSNHIEVTISSLEGENIDISGEDATIIDSIPTEWTVQREFGDVEKVEEEDGRKQVYLGEVTKSQVEDAEDGVTREYFVKSPDTVEESGGYTFGPARAEVVTTDDDETVELSDEFGGTDTNYVVGQSQP